MLCVSATHTFTSGKWDVFVNTFFAEFQRARSLGFKYREPTPRPTGSLACLRLLLPQSPHNTFQNDAHDCGPLNRGAQPHLAIKRVRNVYTGTN